MQQADSWVTLRLDLLLVSVSARILLICCHGDLQYVQRSQGLGADMCSCCASYYLSHSDKSHHIQSYRISMVTMGQEACHQQKENFLPPWKFLCTTEEEQGPGETSNTFSLELLIYWREAVKSDVKHELLGSGQSLAPHYDTELFQRH